jgi:hypothetical protein
MMIKELDSVVLTTNLPEHGLARDDIGTVVLVHEGGQGCTVEFMKLAGRSIAVVTLLACQIRQLPRTKLPMPAISPQRSDAPVQVSTVRIDASS